MKPLTVIYDHVFNNWKVLKRSDETSIIYVEHNLALKNILKKVFKGTNTELIDLLKSSPKRTCFSGSFFSKHIHYSHVKI